MPYYERNNITIYCGDSLNLLSDAMSFDCVITDPPYGIDYQSARRKDKAQWKPKIQGDKEFPLWIFEKVKYNVALFVWMRWDILPQVPTPKSFIVWDKGTHSMGNLKHEFGRRWEGCAFYPGPAHAFTKRPQDIIFCPKIPAVRLNHPNEKPIGAILPLIEAHESREILDPFMGSGSTLLAAAKLNRKAIGIELAESYCEIAAGRLDAYFDSVEKENPNDQS